MLPNNSASVKSSVGVAAEAFGSLFLSIDSKGFNGKLNGVPEEAGIQLRYQKKRGIPEISLGVFR